MHPNDLLNKTKILTASYIGNKVFSDPLVKEFIINLNRKDQLFNKGIDYQGSTLPLYKPDSKKRPGDRYDLFDKGVFYKSYEVIPQSDGSAILRANTIRNDFDIQKISSQYIVGLTEENHKKLVEFCREIIAKIIREVVGSL